MLRNPNSITIFKITLHVSKWWTQFTIRIFFSAVTQKVSLKEINGKLSSGFRVHFSINAFISLSILSYLSSLKHKLVRLDLLDVTIHFKISLPSRMSFTFVSLLIFFYNFFISGKTRGWTTGQERKNLELSISSSCYTKICSEWLDTNSLLLGRHW